MRLQWHTMKITRSSYGELLLITDFALINMGYCFVSINVMEL